MTYNLSNFTDANSFTGVSIAANQLVGGWLFVFVIGLIYLISFIALKRYETKYALITSGFIALVLTVSLWGVGVVSENVLVVVFTLFLLSLGLGIID